MDVRLYDRALHYFMKALRIFQDSLVTDRNRVHLSTCYNNIGRVYEMHE